MLLPVAGYKIRNCNANAYNIGVILSRVNGYTMDYYNFTYILLKV